MFERYSQEAKDAIFYARAAVTAMHNRQMETGHLLLGILEAREVSQEAQTAVEELLKSWYPVAPTKIEENADVPLSDDLKRVLALANKYSIDDWKEVQLHHLLAAILNHPTTQGEPLNV